MYRSFVAVIVFSRGFYHFSCQLSLEHLIMARLNLYRLVRRAVYNVCTVCVYSTSLWAIDLTNQTVKYECQNQKFKFFCVNKEMLVYFWFVQHWINCWVKTYILCVMQKKKKSQIFAFISHTAHANATKTSLWTHASLTSRMINCPAINIAPKRLILLSLLIWKMGTWKENNTEF